MLYLILCSMLYLMQLVLVISPPVGYLLFTYTQIADRVARGRGSRRGALCLVLQTAMKCVCVVSCVVGYSDREEIERQRPVFNLRSMEVKGTAT